MEPSTSVLLVGAGPSLRLLFDAAVASGDFDVVEAELGADAEEWAARLLDSFFRK